MHRLSRGYTSYNLHSSLATMVLCLSQHLTAHNLVICINLQAQYEKLLQSRSVASVSSSTPVFDCFSSALGFLINLWFDCFLKLTRNQENKMCTHNCHVLAFVRIRKRLQRRRHQWLNEVCVCFFLVFGSVYKHSHALALFVPLSWDVVNTGVNINILAYVSIFGFACVLC